MLLSEGQALYVHCSTHLHQLTRNHPFPKAQLVDRDMGLDLGPLNAEGDTMILLATKPLTRGEPWQALCTGEFRVYAQGHEVWRQINPQTQAFPMACPDPDLKSRRMQTANPDFLPPKLSSNGVSGFWQGTWLCGQSHGAVDLGGLFGNVP
jgi:hypothetical protein